MYQFLNIRLGFSEIFLTLSFCISAVSKLLFSFGVPREFSYGLYVVLLVLYVLVKIPNIKSKPDLIIAYLILFPVLIYSCTSMVEAMQSTTAFYAFVLTFFPAYYIFRVSKYSDIVKGLVAGSYISLVICLLQVLVGDTSQLSYMSFGYDVLFPLCIVVYRAVRSRKIIDIALSVCGLLMIVLFGSRGSLVFFGVFLLYSLSSILGWKRVVYLAVAIVVACALLANLQVFVGLFSSMGVESRTLEKIASSSFFDSESRMRLYEYLWGLLPGNYLGLGPFGSRLVLPTFYTYLTYPYPHSVFFELLLDYGIFFGTVVFVFVFVIAVRSFWIAYTSEERMVTAAINLACMLPLFISGTFYTSFALPFVVANYFNMSDAKRKRLESQKEKRE